MHLRSLKNGDYYSNENTMDFKIFDKHNQQAYKARQGQNTLESNPKVPFSMASTVFMVEVEWAVTKYDKSRAYSFKNESAK